MLDKDVLTRDTIRMLMSEIKRFEIDNKAEAGEETILSIIQKMVKQRNDSIEQFQKGGRKDLADKEISQLEIIKKYMPAQMSAEEIELIINDVIKSTNSETMQDMGKVMGAAKSQLQGKADMSLVSDIVKQLLSG
jgi:uncharacterized protein YqeY